MEFYSVIRKNETMCSEGQWMQLEDIMVGKVSQAQKAKAACFLSYMGDRHNTNTINFMKNRLR
jgi:hypothetical protein